MYNYIHYAGIFGLIAAGICFWGSWMSNKAIEKEDRDQLVRIDRMLDILTTLLGVGVGIFLIVTLPR